MSTDLLSQLSALKLHGMADAWADIQAESHKPTKTSPEEMLWRLIRAEIGDRQVRSLRYQLTTVKFPIHRNLIDF